MAFIAAEMSRVAAGLRSVRVSSGASRLRRSSDVRAFDFELDLFVSFLVGLIMKITSSHVLEFQFGSARVVEALVPSACLYSSVLGTSTATTMFSDR